MLDKSNQELLRRIESLASQLLFHKKQYYLGKSILTDPEYDKLEQSLRDLDPEHPVLSYVGYSLPVDKTKIPHTVPMLSLEKTYDILELWKFTQEHPCVVMDKFDGMALSLVYDNRGILIEASTRGNGLFGENVLEHVYHIPAIPKKIPVQKVFAAQGRSPAEGTEQRWERLEIRGEVYFPLSCFERHQEQFDSLRNAVPGTMGRKDPHTAVPVLNSFGFFPYDMILFLEAHTPLNTTQLVGLFADDFNYLKKIKFVRDLGFLFDDYMVHAIPFHKDAQELGAYVDWLLQTKRDYLIDGLVFRIQDERVWEQLGNTSHHPRGSLAFKQAGETAVTEILDIEDSIGRSGKITFRAKLKPVSLSGATISYATLHNADYIEQGPYAIGAQVEVIRSGEVIPAIVSLIQPGPTPYVLPTVCRCGSPLSRQGPDLMCLQNKNCMYKDQESLVHFVASLNILGVSDKIILKMRQAGLLNEPSDLFRISVLDLAQLPGLGQKSAENIVTAIQNSRTMPLWQFLTALGLKRGGVVKCRDVARTYKTLDAVLLLTPKELTLEKGWAEKSATDFITSLHDKIGMITGLKAYVTIVDDSSKTANDTQTMQTQSPYAGKAFCITGNLSQPRAHFVALLEAQGARVVSTVTSKTDYLLCNEASASSKYKEAQKLGVRIISEEELLVL